MRNKTLLIILAGLGFFLPACKKDVREWSNEYYGTHGIPYAWVTDQMTFLGDYYSGSSHIQDTVVWTGMPDYKIVDFIAWSQLKTNIPFTPTSLIPDSMILYFDNGLINVQSANGDFRVLYDLKYCLSNQRQRKEYTIAPNRQVRYWYASPPDSFFYDGKYIEMIQTGVDSVQTNATETAHVKMGWTQYTGLAKVEYCKISVLSGDTLERFVLNRVTK